MGLLIGLLVVILFLKLFVNISVGFFKLLLGLFVVVAAFTIIPIGLALIVPFIIIVALLSFAGLILRLIF